MPFALPKGFQAKSSPFVLSATHRGDMYHVRAAIMSDKDARSLVLFDCPREGKQNDLTEFLIASIKQRKMDYFCISDNLDVLKGDPSKFPSDSKGYIPNWFFNGKPVLKEEMTAAVKGFISESDCTDRISKLVSSGAAAAAVQKISDGMHIIPKEAVSDLHSLYATTSLFPLGKPKTPVVLVLHRDTGANLGGAYPELDSGDALWQLLDMIEAMKGADGKGSLSTCLSGDIVDKRKKAPSIGRYWESLKKVHAGMADKHGGISQRDVENFFFRWAYDQGLFHMVAGFRSGQLDLFTFMGIPTLSIGLRNLVGEDRHNLLAKKLLRRVNVEYSTPRAKATAWIQGRGGSNAAPLLHSPYWLGSAPEGCKAPRPPAANLSDADKKSIIKEGPGPFTSFDSWIVKVGLGLVTERYLKGWGITIGNADKLGDLVTAKEARSCYDPSNLAGGKAKFWKDRRAEEARDIKERFANAKLLQETDEIRKSYESEFENGWGFIQKEE